MEVEVNIENPLKLLWTNTNHGSFERSNGEARANVWVGKNSDNLYKVPKTQIYICHMMI